MGLIENQEEISYLKNDIKKLEEIIKSIKTNFESLEMEELSKEKFYEGLYNTKMFLSFLKYLIM